jgi:hypothetical protein
MKSILKYPVLLAFFPVIILLSGCGGKTVAFEQRVGEPRFRYEVFIHGINPQKITSSIYDDGYVITTIDNVYSGEGKETKGDFVSKNRVSELVSFFLSEGFLDMEPLSMPALYGGEVVTISFYHDGKSQSLKFLKGTKLPPSFEKCWDRLHALIEHIIEP